MAKTIRGKIITFGSYRLRVNHQNADIDCCALAPRDIGRGALFTVLKGAIESTQGVTKVQPRPKAKVPILKFCFNEIEIDLLIARSASEKPKRLILIYVAWTWRRWTSWMCWG